MLMGVKSKSISSNVEVINIRKLISLFSYFYIYTGKESSQVSKTYISGIVSHEIFKIYVFKAADLLKNFYSIHILPKIQIKSFFISNNIFVVFKLL